MLSLYSLSSLIWQHVWLEIFNLVMDNVRTHCSVDKTLVASEICCHQRAFCDSSTWLENRLPKDFGHQTSKRRCEEWTEVTPQSVEPRRLSCWCRNPRGQEYRLQRYPHTSSKNQHRYSAKWWSENFGVSRHCQGPCTNRQTVETWASFSYHVRVNGLRLFPV